MSALLWLLQRASGLVLVILAGLHVGVHYGLLPFSIRRPALIVVDWFLLTFLLYHGLNGVRTVAYDYVTRPQAQRLVDWVLWAAGLALFAYGSWGLTLLIR